MPILMSLLGGLGGAGGGVTSIFKSVIGGLSSAVSSIISTASSLVSSAVGLIGTAASMFVSVLQSSISALTDFANSVTSMADLSGTSREVSLNLTNDLRSVGISAQTTSQIFGSTGMNIELFNRRAATLGAPKMDGPDSVSKLINWYQSQKNGSVGSKMAADAKVSALFNGNIPPVIMKLLNSDPKTMQKEIDYGRNTQKSLGVSPEMINQFSSEFPLLLNRISSFVETVKMRFASELLPTLQMVFGFISELFAKNADGIASSISTFARWMFVEMPDLAVNGLRAVINMASSMAEAFFQAGEAGVALLRALAGKEGGLYMILATAANFIDGFTEIGTSISVAFVYLKTMVSNGVAMFLNLIPGLNKNKIKRRDPNEAAQEVYEKAKKSSVRAKLDRSIDKSDLGGKADKLQGLIDKGRAGAATLKGGANQAFDFVQNSIGTKEERENALKQKNEKTERESALLGKLDQVVNATKHGADRIEGAINKNATGASTTSAALGHIGASIAMRVRRRGV